MLKQQKLIKNGLQVFDEAYLGILFRNTVENTIKHK